MHSPFPRCAISKFLLCELCCTSRWCSNMGTAAQLQGCIANTQFTVMISACLQLEFATAFHRLCGKKVLFPQGFHCTGMPIKVPKLPSRGNHQFVPCLHLIPVSVSLCSLFRFCLLLSISLHWVPYCTLAIVVCRSSATRLQFAGSDDVQPTRVCDAAGMC